MLLLFLHLVLYVFIIRTTSTTRLRQDVGENFADSFRYSSSHFCCVLTYKFDGANIVYISGLILFFFLKLFLELCSGPLVKKA